MEATHGGWFAPAGTETGFERAQRRSRHAERLIRRGLSPAAALKAVGESIRTIAFLRPMLNRIARTARAIVPSTRRSRGSAGRGQRARTRRATTSRDDGGDPDPDPSRRCWSRRDPFRRIRPPVTTRPAVPLGARGIRRFGRKGQR